MCLAANNEQFLFRRLPSPPPTLATTPLRRTSHRSVQRLSHASFWRRASILLCCSFAYSSLQHERNTSLLPAPASLHEPAGASASSFVQGATRCCFLTRSCPFTCSCDMRYLQGYDQNDAAFLTQSTNKPTNEPEADRQYVLLPEAQAQAFQALSTTHAIRVWLWPA